MENQENGLTVTNWATPEAPAFSLLLFGRRPCCQREESGRHLLGLLAAHTEGVGAGTGACRTHPFSEWGPGILNAGGEGGVPEAAAAATPGNLSEVQVYSRLRNKVSR